MNEEIRWCLTGPDLLIDDASLPHFPPLAPPLPTTSTTTDGLLGRRFEQHWRSYFEHHPDWRILAADQPIQDGKRTLGAPDFVVNNVAKGEVWHIELAIKFYLRRPDRSGASLSDWVGPSVRDRLDLKVTRMQTHQLRLFEHPAAREWLRANSLPPPTRRAAVVKGVLFAPWDGPPTVRPPLMAAHQPAGRWCTIGALDAAITEASVLERKQWLGAPAPPRQSGAALRAAIEAQQALRKGSPVQLAVGDERWFVVSDRWLASLATI